MSMHLQTENPDKDGQSPGSRDSGSSSSSSSDNHKIALASPSGVNTASALSSSPTTYTSDVDVPVAPRASAPPIPQQQALSPTKKLNGNSAVSTARTSPLVRGIDMATSESARKRNTTTRSNAGASGSDADEHAPIIQHGREPGARDYMSISPSGGGARKTMSGATTEGERNGGEDRNTEPREQGRRAQEEAAQTERRERGWWAGVMEKYGAVELENKGSVARDHLALERTYLAWLRTSLSFASIGIAITQLFRLNTTISPSKPPSNPHQPSPQARLRHVGKPLGATFIAISILILVIGFHRYFESQHYVIRGKFPASRGSILIVTLVAGGLIVVSLVVVLVVGPVVFER